MKEESSVCETETNVGSVFILDMIDEELAGKFQVCAKFSLNFKPQNIKSNTKTLFISEKGHILI